MDDSFPLPKWLRQALIGLGLFLLGGLLAFGYSYHPLHGALNWKVEQLEERLDARNLENLRLSDELAKLRSSEAESVDPESFAEVERELEKTRTTLAQAEKDLSRAQSKRKDANADAGRWRKRYEKLRDELKVASTPPAQAPAAGTSSPAAPAPGDSVPPATPAPGASLAPGPSTGPNGAGTLPPGDAGIPTP